MKKEEDEKTIIIPDNPQNTRKIIPEVAMTDLNEVIILEDNNEQKMHDVEHHAEKQEIVIDDEDKKEIKKVANPNKNDSEIKTMSTILRADLKSSIFS